jgi:drug/metabolite transporter (DMT)-like permease
VKKVAEYIQKVNRSRSWGRLIGMTLVLCGATLWGVSGNAAQYLFETQKVSAGWLTSVRMLTAGVLLLAIMQCGKHRQQVWAIWKQRRSASSLVVFGLVGMIGSQYTYFEAVAAGNAATATLLQYLSPVLILLFSILFMRKKPKMIELTAMVIALLGVFFLVTKGHPNQLSIAPGAIIWGLLAALGGAIYATQPASILKQFGPGVVVGWGMVIGGAAMSLFYPPWIFHGQWSMAAFIGIVFVILFGTLIAFYLYLASLSYLKPLETSMLGCAEPLSAALVSVVWLHVPFTLFDWLGALCIIGTVVSLAFAQKNLKNKRK